MSAFVLLEGIAIGFLLSTPLGPIGVLCVRETLATGRRHGYMVGVAGALVDILYGAVAAFGITLISDFISSWQDWIRLGGGIFLLILGLRILRAGPTANPKGSGIGAHGFLSTIFLGLTNPLTVFAFGAIFSAIDVGRLRGDVWSLLLLVGGISVGSFLWFFVLANLAHRFRGDFTAEGFRTVNRVVGGLMGIFGFVAMWIGVGNLFGGF